MFTSSTSMRPPCRCRLVGAAVILATLMLAPAAGAQEAEPKHVFRVAQTMMKEVALLHRADLRDFKRPEVREIPGRKPRHVLMEARRVYESVQELRFLNGLERKELEPVPVRHVRPADVREMGDRALADLRNLREVYGVEEVVEQPPLREEITPTDVHVKFRELQAALRTLGVPAIVPNDVYRRAEMLANELDKLAEHYGVPGRQPVDEPSTDKTPPDVYARVVELGERVAALAEDAPDLDVPGGVSRPPDPDHEPTPADVLGVIRLLLADVTAIKAELGIESPAEVPPQRVGRTPSDVYDLARVCAGVLGRIESKLNAS